MAVVLGKRKRRADVEGAKAEKKKKKKVLRRGGDVSEQSSSDEDARALFQKAFEAKFRPLERTEKLVVEEEEEDDDDEVEEAAESDWGGLSESDDEVEVIEHALPEVHSIDDMLSGKRSFMSSKPPKPSDEGPKAGGKTSRPPITDEDNNTETANLKNDLDLQRLLKESHLLDPSSFNGVSSTTPKGKTRLKALDMRLQSLGAKSSVLQQEKMPLSHRRGIVSKNVSREASRRKEAAENGVILERVRDVGKAQMGKTKKRDRGLGGPGVGKFRGGTLRLSSRDVASIQRDGGRNGRGGSKGRGGRGGRR